MSPALLQILSDMLVLEDASRISWTQVFQSQLFLDQQSPSSSPSSLLEPLRPSGHPLTIISQYIGQKSDLVSLYANLGGMLHRLSCQHLEEEVV